MDQNGQDRTLQNLFSSYNKFKKRISLAEIILKVENVH